MGNQIGKRNELTNEQRDRMDYKNRANQQKDRQTEVKTDKQTEKLANDEQSQ